MVSQSPILAFKHTENQSFQSHLILTSILDGRTDNAKSEFRIMFSKQPKFIFQKKNKKECVQPFTVSKSKSLRKTIVNK